VQLIESITTRIARLVAWASDETIELPPTSRRRGAPVFPKVATIC
jgi:hypothetical protein